MAQGLEKAKTCGVCISRNTPSGWFREEIARALNRQSKDPSFRVIPIILPNGDNKIVDDFLELRTWVDFKDGIDDGYSLHVLASGILGESPGRYPAQQTAINAELAGVRPILQGIKALREEQLIDENIAFELQRRVVYPIFVLGK